MGERDIEKETNLGPLCSSSWLGYEAIRSSSRLRHHSAFVCESPFLRRFRARLFAYLSSMSKVASVVSFVQVMWKGFFGSVARCLLRSLSTGFLGRHRLSPKLKRLWYPSVKVLLFLSVGGPNFVNVSLLKKNIVIFVLSMSSSFFTLCTDESMCAMRSALLHVEIDFHVRLDICISFDDSFIASAETKVLDWKTHELPKCSWGELPSGFRHCQFSLVQKSKEIFGGFSGLSVQITQVWFQYWRFVSNDYCCEDFLEFPRWVQFKVCVLLVRRNMARKHVCFVNIFVS